MLLCVEVDCNRPHPMASGKGRAWKSRADKKAESQRPERHCTKKRARTVRKCFIRMFTALARSTEAWKGGLAAERPLPRTFLGVQTATDRQFGIASDLSKGLVTQLRVVRFSQEEWRTCFFISSSGLPRTLLGLARCCLQ